jgi:starch phosphorylase
VHPWTWTAEGFSRLYTEHFPGWCHEPEVLVRADEIPDADIWQAHAEAKRDLIALVGRRGGTELDPKAMTIGFARRMTAYKRPALLFSDLAALRALAERHPLQIVLAGKAHPRDEPGKELIEHLHECQRELGGANAIRVAFVPGYDMATARTIIAGVDVWLNTPRPPLEASGTSGMKAAFNGVPSLSVLDGWWIEGCIPGVTGWAIDPGSDDSDRAAAAALYARLRDEVLPAFHGDRPRWIAIMLRRYVSDAYFT